MSGFDDDLKTIRIPVKFVGGGMVLPDGQPLPPIRDGASGELRLPDHAVADGEIKQRCQSEATIPMLEPGTSVFFSMMAHQVPAELWKEAKQKNSFRDGPEGPCVEVRLEEALKLRLRGSKTPTLRGCKCKIPCLDNEEAKSLNHAYTLISSHFETERVSHSGNVFQLGRWYDGKRKQWIVLDALRMARQTEYEAKRKAQAPSPAPKEKRQERLPIAGPATQFVLSLEEGLRRLEARPREDELKFRASLYIIPLESETLNRVMCPQCGHHGWKVLVQMALSGLASDRPNESLDWPFGAPAGDRLHCQCARCGHKVTVTFWYTR